MGEKKRIGERERECMCKTVRRHVANFSVTGDGKLWSQQNLKRKRLFKNIVKLIALRDTVLYTLNLLKE